MVSLEAEGKEGSEKEIHEETLFEKESKLGVSVRSLSSEVRSANFKVCLDTVSSENTIGINLHLTIIIPCMLMYYLGILP